MQKELEAASKLVDTLVEFSITYGFQILGALLFLFIGLKLAGWSGRKVLGLIAARNVDAALSRLLGNLGKLLVIVFVMIITLGNFVISIAPLIALAGAAAFGATMALQGPLSNYGAGFAILIGEDKERIVVLNKGIVGEVIVNSRQKPIVETRLPSAAPRMRAGPSSCCGESWKVRRKWGTSPHHK